MSRQSLGPRLFLARRITATALALLLLTQTTGCVTWEPQTNPIPSLRNAKSTDSYRITLAGKRVVHLTNVRIQGDSVFGADDSETTRYGLVQHERARVGFPLTEVRSIERQSDHSLVVIVAVAAVVGLVVMTGQDAMSGNWMGSGPIW